MISETLSIKTHYLLLNYLIYLNKNNNKNKNFMLIFNIWIIYIR